MTALEGAVHGQDPHHRRPGRRLRAAPTAASTSSFRPPARRRIGTNPEQLFAAGWSACFISAMGLAASKRKIALAGRPGHRRRGGPASADGGYFLQARLNVSLPGLERELAQALVDEAHQICPYSKATRGNIDVAINLV